MEDKDVVKAIGQMLWLYENDWQRLDNIVSTIKYPSTSSPAQTIENAPKN